MTPQDELRLIRALNSEDITSSQELKIMRAFESGEGSADDILGMRQSSLGGLRAPSFDDLDNVSDLKDREMFDYKTGAKGGLRAKLSFMETAEEKENLLRNIVGEEGYTKDADGRLALTEAGQINQGMESIGKNLIIEDEGFSFRDLADLTGVLPETVGAVGGAILGAPGVVTSGLGAAGGAALGQSVEEIIEKMLGLQKQSFGEVALDVGKEALLAGTLDVAGNLIFRAGKAVIGGGLRAAKQAGGRGSQSAINVAGETPEAQALRILKADSPGLPSLESAGLPSPIARMGRISQTVSGNKDQAINNVLYALDQKDKLLQSAGVASVDDVADVIKNAVPQKAKALETQLLEAQKSSMRAIESGVETLSKATDEGVDLSDDLLKSLTDNYASFTKLAEQNYKAVNDVFAKINRPITIGRGPNQRTVTQTAGEYAFFDIGHLKTQYDDVIRQEYGGSAAAAPEAFTEFGEQLRQLIAAGEDLGSEVGFTSFKGLRGFRKNIRDTLSDRSLSMGETTPRRLLTNMMDEVDKMMQGDIPISFKGVGQGGSATIKKGLALHKKAQAEYAKEISVFRKLETLGILRNLGEATKDVKLEAGRNFLKITENKENIKAVLNAIEKRGGDVEDVRRGIARKYLDDALSNSGKDSLDPLSFNGVKFHTQIENIRRSGVGKELFGKDWGQVQSLSKALSYNGVKKMDDEVLRKIIQQNPGDDVVSTLRNVSDAQIGLNKALSATAISKLAKGTLDPEEAAAAILNPNMQRSQMIKVLDFFKDDPTARKTIEDAVLRDILGSVDEKIFISESAASSLSNAIKAYKPETLDLVLGKDKMKGIRQLADDLVFLKDTGAKGAGSLAADAIRTGIVTSPIKNFGKSVRFKIINRLVNNPDALKKYLEARVKSQSPQAISQGIVQQLNDATAAVTGSTTPLSQTAAGAANTISKVSEGLNRAKIASRQAGARAILAEQESRGTQVPNVTAPQSELFQQDIFFGSPVGPTFKGPEKQTQSNLRQRAAQNPYIASSLLGGLGNADLL